MDLLVDGLWKPILAIAIGAVAGVLLHRKYWKSERDIQWPRIPSTLHWSDPAAIEESMSQICQYAIGFGDNSISWYQSRRRAKRTAGFLLRAGALLATVGAGVVPLSEGLVAVKIPAVVSTLLIALAGLFVSIDSLGGFTSGWVRYMLAQQKIERLRDVFVLEWNGLQIGSAAPTVMLERVKTFLLSVGKVVDDETQEWATEFQNALKELERTRKADAETLRTGSVEISVKNPERANGGWTLEIDGSLRGHTTGKTMAVTDVPTGTRKVSAHGQDDQGRPLSDEHAIKVEGGMIISREFELA